MTALMRNTYLEGSRIMSLSLLGAAAISGIVLWQIQADCDVVGDSLSQNIDELIKSGKLSDGSKMKMEYIITIRDAGVHVNETDIRRDKASVVRAYKYLNDIAAKMLSRPVSPDPEVAEVLPYFESLSPKRRKFIRDRDKGRKS
jgi:hypothetical protein